MTTDLTSVRKIELTLQSLELQSLDTDSLFAALSSVEKAIPVLLSCIKPILAHLSSPNQNTTSDEEISGEAKNAIGHYMDLLDKIQFVLRQTVYYLHETKASSNTLRPPHPNSIPTPFASTLPDISSLSTSNDASAISSNSDVKTKSGEVELGLYGKRIEARTLREMIDVLGRLEGVVPPHLARRSGEQGGLGGDKDKMDMEVDATPKEDVRI